MSSHSQDRILPGFGLTLGFSVLYLSLVVLIPLSTVFLQAVSLSLTEFWDVISAPRVLASLKLSIGASFAAAMTNLVCGTMLAWVLVRYRFPIRGLIDALVDLPFALPTAVAGISLTSLYCTNGLMGQWLHPLGIKVAYTPLGVFVALTFVGLPFVVRTVQPVIQDLNPELEAAAKSLGANNLTTFFKVILPAIWPSMLTGFSLALARGMGEYGSVVFISGNMPMRTEIVPLLIMTKLDQFDMRGATALALLMLIISFFLMLCANVLQSVTRRRATTNKSN